MERLAAMDFVTSHAGEAILNGLKPGLRVIEEAFWIAAIIGGSLAALLALLILALSSCWFVAELHKVSRCREPVSRLRERRFPACYWARRCRCRVATLLPPQRYAGTVGLRMPNRPYRPPRN